MDGTLIDSIDFYFRIIEEVYRRLELAVPPREVILEAARNAKGNFRKILPDNIMGVKNEVIDQTMAIIGEISPRMFLEEVSLFPGVVDLLNRISEEGIKIGLVTSTHLRYLDGKLYPFKKAGVANLIKSVICIEDVLRFKPEPDPLIECAKRLEVSRGKSVYVGDLHTDIRAGKAAGMKTVGVLTGIDDYQALKKEDPDMIIDTVAELLQIIHLK